MEQNKALSVLDVAKILHVSKNTVYEMIRRGEINSYRVGRKIRFTQEDVDSYIARSRHEKRLAPVHTVSGRSSLLTGRLPQGREFVLSGQDVILDILSNYLRQYNIQALRAYVGSFESILALYQDNVQAATAHLWDSTDDCYNIPYVRRLMPGTHAVIINLSYRMQGFYVGKGNPKHIWEWKDLMREDVRMLNRRKGSGSRILLDEKMMSLGISPRKLRGYEDEIGSHLTLAQRIAEGQADVGLGTERVTRQMDGLDFVPVQEERYDLILKKECFYEPEIQTMVDILRSAEFSEELKGISGNDYRDLGKIMAEV